MEILEGNKLIAEFIGFNIKGNTQWIENEDYPDKGMIERDGTIEDLEYHTSWDWLMPVVEKIEALDSDEGKFEVYIFKRCCDIQTESGSDHIVEITAAPNKIEAVYTAVVEFIKNFINTPK